MVTLKQLRFALAVAKTRHFKRAAEQCSVSQSGLSTAITELEKQLGVQLFERDNKQVLVTPIGEQLLQRAAAISADVDDLISCANQAQGQLQYPMSVGVIPTIAPFLLPKVFPRLSERYPNFTMSIVEDHSERLVAMVRQGELDTAILALPYPHDGLHAFSFWQENFHAVLHRDEALASQGSVSAQSLAKARLMLLGDGHCLRDHTLAVCQMPPSELDSVFKGVSLNTLIQMTLSRLGTTLVPQMALSQLLSQHPELRAVPLDEPGPHREVAFITRLNYARVGEIQQLMQLMKTALMSD